MEQQIRMEWVELQSGAGTEDAIAIDAYAATPQGEGEFPVVVVIQEIFGVNDHIRQVTERVAKLGYVAIAPAIYQRQIKGFERGYDSAAVIEGRKYKEQTRADELLRDIQAAMDFGRSLPQGKEGGCGCMGFCFGGHVGYLGATLPEMAATAVFYGAGITTWCPGEIGATVDRTDQIKGRLLGFFGAADSLISLDQVEALKESLAKNQVDHAVRIYDGADHGFFCGQRGSYNERAAADAWQRVVALFSDFVYEGRSLGLLHLLGSWGRCPQTPAKGAKPLWTPAFRLMVEMISLASGWTIGWRFLGRFQYIGHVPQEIPRQGSADR